jgi:transcriptional regulator with XRE-family HTH domain
MTDLYPIQIRTARALLDWSREVLSERSGVGIRTILRIEREEVIPHRNTIDRIRTALEADGVIFIDEGGTVGVAIRRDNPPTV